MDSHFIDGRPRRHALLNTHVAAWRTRVAETRLFSAIVEAKVDFGVIARRHPRDPATRSSVIEDQGSELAERVGFEPTCRLPDKTLSRRPRYDHFGTSPVVRRPT